MTAPRLVLLLSIACLAAAPALAHPHTVPPPLSFDIQVRDVECGRNLVRRCGTVEKALDAQQIQRRAFAQQTLERREKAGE